jgi:hypothetical protein
VVRTDIEPGELGIYDMFSKSSGLIPSSAPAFLTTGVGKVRHPGTGRFIGGKPGDIFDVTKEARTGWKQALAVRDKATYQGQFALAKTRLRIDFDTFITDSTYPALDGWRRYIEMGKQYIAKEGGGMIGDAVKIEYFTYGKGKWEPLASRTIKHKAMLASKGEIKPETVTHPLQRQTTLADLPVNWTSYLKIRGFPQNKGLTEAGSRITVSSLIKGRQRWYDMVPLMDAVATMNPKAKFWGKTGVRSYEQMIQSVSRAGALGGVQGGNDLTQFTRIQVSGVMEAFRFSPSAFSHEMGYYNVKAKKRVKPRPFISRGIYEGNKRIAHFWEIYMRHGEKVMKQQYGKYMQSVITEAEQISTQYFIAGRKAVAKYRGKGGMTKLPRSYTYWALGDDPSKFTDINLTVRGMFGNHIIWWFLPPSKWWHYVGVMDDLRSIVKGGIWSLSSIQAWVAAMMKGIMGARMGSPVPFTRKARRRKFRKGLYSRAGYHRQYVGGR